MVKIVDAIRQAAENGRHFVGFEFVAPTTEAGTITLYDRIERLSALDPLFCGVTWGEHCRTAETSIEVASTCQSLLSVNYQVNLTGYTSDPDEVLKWLSLLKTKGVRNVLLTRGAVTVDTDAALTTAAPSPLVDSSGEEVDANTSVSASSAAAASATAAPPAGHAFPHAVDLVRFVRQHFGDHFGIAVVAFPEGDLGPGDCGDGVPTWTSARQDSELLFLKEKVDAGADYIITQSVFDADVFERFCGQCRRRGIRCPILPGVLPVSHARHLTSPALRRLAGAAELHRRIVAVKGGDAEVKRVVVAFYQHLVTQLLARGCGGVYFFTMNVDALLVAILKGIDVATHRILPWRPSENEERRRQETVRPVHWSSRVTSYMVRTAHWRDAARERWNPVSGTHHSSAVALGEAGGYHARLLLRSRARRCTQFLVIQGMSEVQSALTELSRIFLAFLDGCGTLPWADELSGETMYVGEHLLKPLNARGLFTINSQPPVNGAPSSHKVVGWGPPGGFVYQKSYVEFFCPLSSAQTVFATLEKYPSLQYIAMNAQGGMVRARWRMDSGSGGADGDAEPSQQSELAQLAAGMPPVSPLSPTTPTAQRQSPMSLFGTGVTAVTWGVFPGREVIQPTIVSVDSFRAWVGEAFDLWAAPFPANDVPAVVHYIQQEWVLVSVVDNIFQESPTPLEHAVVEICSKIPPLTPAEWAKAHPRSSLSFAPGDGIEVNTLGQFVRAS